MSTEKRKHHFVPQSYLRGFTIEGKKSLIWEYDKNQCRISKNPKSVRNICCRDYYYEQRIEGQSTQILEDGFAELEAAAIGIVRSLYELKSNLTDYEKGTLAYYIALLLARGPAFRDGCRTHYKFFAEIMFRRIYESGILPEPPDILKKHIKNNDIASMVSAEVIPQVSLQPMLDIAEHFGKSLCDKKWTVYFSKDMLFATSDTPVMFGKSSESEEVISPADPKSYVFCPLNKHMLLAARPYISSDTQTCDCKNAKSEAVELLNRMICYVSQRFIYFPERSDKLLEYARSAQGYSQKLRTYRFGDTIIQKWTVEEDNRQC